MRYRFRAGWPLSVVVVLVSSARFIRNASLVATLQLETVGEARAGAPGGQVVTMPIVRIDTLQIGEAVAAGVDAPSRDYNQGKADRIDGVIALNLFRDYLVTLDFEQGRLRIASGSLPDPDGRELFAYGGSRGIAELPISVGGQSVVADVDTGSMGGITMPSPMADTLTLASPPAVVGRAVTVSGTIEITAAPLKGAVTIGRHTIANPMVEFASVMPRVNLGIRVLRHFALTFDQRRQRLRLSRSSTAPIELGPAK